MNDNWLLKIPPIAEDGQMDFTKFKWEKRKNPGYSPNPTRSGQFSLAFRVKSTETVAER